MSRYVDIYALILRLRFSKGHAVIPELNGAHDDVMQDVSAIRIPYREAPESLC